jgi:hypothetical protein
MKPYTLLISLIIISAGEITLNAQNFTEDTLSSLKSWDLEQVTNSEDEIIRSENINLIEKTMRDIQKAGKLKDEPLIIINNESFSYQEYISMKDTISSLGKGKILEISIYSETCGNKLIEQYNRPINSGVLEITISKEYINDTKPEGASQGNDVPTP